jgi:Asp/Glu/hydantoin racemase
MPKIYLVHAMALSMGPVEASFRKLWPQPRLAHLLEDSLPADLKQDGRLTEQMIGRFRDLGRYCAGAGADAILFSCSAFGPAIDAVKHDQKIPVLKPNEALYNELIATGGRTALLATFPPSLPSMAAEIKAHALQAGAKLEVRTCLVEGALDALTRGNADEHNRLIAEAALAYADCESIAFAQFSMAPAATLAEARLGKPVLTTPDSAVRKLKALMT